MACRDNTAADFIMKMHCLFGLAPAALALIDSGYARSAWTLCGSLGVGWLARRRGGWRRKNKLGFTLGFEGGKPFLSSAAVWPGGFAQHFVTEISDGCLARWQTVLREQFSDRTERNPSLPQLDDDIPSR